MKKDKIKVNDEFEEIETRSVDKRNRLTIGEFAEGFNRFRLYKNSVGEILLKPVIEIPASELWLFQNKEAFEDIQKGIKDLSEGKVLKLDIEELQEQILFEIFFTEYAKTQLKKLKKDKGLTKKYNAAKKAIIFLSENPRRKSLNTHEFTSLKEPSGEKVFEAYAEQSTLAAYRVFWCYGPTKDQITILAITPHP